MNYEEAKSYIENTGSQGIIPGTEIIKQLLGLLGDPQDHLKAIHIAGTNGKGAVCAYLESALLECGLKVGRYSSPAVIDPLEIIRLDGSDISEEDYEEYVSRVKDAAENMEHKPTSFEAETAAALIYFADKKADVIIVECGMGGAEDATNVFEDPLAAVFTPVSMDHMKFLGDDPDRIARNKAGIMKKGSPAVISRMPEIILGEKKYDPQAVLASCAESAGAVPVYAGEFKTPAIINNPLAGEFQQINLQTALCTLETISGELRRLYPEAEISIERFAEGVSKTVHPGRYERVCDTPVIIRDGAHNPAAAMELRKALENDPVLSGDVNIHLIMGVFKDKDYEAILRIMLPIAASFTAIDLPDENRRLPSEDLVSAAQRIAKEISGAGGKMIRSEKIVRADSLEDALHLNDPVSGKDVFVVFGSLSLMRYFRD